MSTFEIDGLGKWKRAVVLWGLIGLLSAIDSKPPLLLVLIALLLGAGAGAVTIMLTERGKGKLTPFAVYGTLAVLIGITWMWNSQAQGAFYLSLGALFVAAEALASGLLGARLVERLNRKHLDVLSVFDSAGNTRRPLSPPAPEPPPQDLLETFLASLPEPLATEARAFAVPVTIASPFRSLETLPPETSGLSGAALLSPSESWPSKDGDPLEFLARIRLRDLPETAAPVPKTGLLSFFYDVDTQPWGSDESDLGGCAILFHEESETLQASLKPGTGPHPPLRKPLRFHQIEGFTPSEAFEDRFRELIEDSDEETGEQLDDLHELLAEAQPHDSHRVLSPPSLVQGDMDEDLRVASRAYGLPEETRWTLLLQLDSDSDLGWCWGDAGYLYFWIPSDDLAAARFDRPWVVLQCT